MLNDFKFFFNLVGAGVLKDRAICRREKSGLHPSTIVKVRFSTFNYETGQHRPSNYQNRANLAHGVVLKMVFHFVRIKNIQFYTKKFISNSF